MHFMHLLSNVIFRNTGENRLQLAGVATGELWHRPATTGLSSSGTQPLVNVFVTAVNLPDVMDDALAFSR